MTGNPLFAGGAMPIRLASASACSDFGGGTIITEGSGAQAQVQ
jgi:hypothetical protein